MQHPFRHVLDYIAESSSSVGGEVLCVTESDYKILGRFPTVRLQKSDIPAAEGVDSSNEDPECKWGGSRVLLAYDSMNTLCLGVVRHHFHDLVNTRWDDDLAKASAILDEKRDHLSVQEVTQQTRWAIPSVAGVYQENNFRLSRPAIGERAEEDGHPGEKVFRFFVEVLRLYCIN